MAMTFSEQAAPAGTDEGDRGNWRRRRRGLSSLLRMGHCAPAVMQTILDLEGYQEDWLVKMTAGLPGGIGNTGRECGGVTSPLIGLGLRYGLGQEPDGLPTVIEAGHDYRRRFRQRHRGLLCREILGDRRVPLPCIKVVCLAPELYRQADGGRGGAAVSGEAREAFLLLYSHLKTNDFHCAHAVLKRLEGSMAVTRQLLDATSAFIGGTAFLGQTCSAYSAGLMAVGLKLGEIEDSHLRVARMLAIMVAGGHAFADHLNKFNRLMNIGHKLAEWFKGEFGSTLCRDITRCDCSSPSDVRRFIEKDSVAGCKKMAEKTARQVEWIIEHNGAGF
jgi:hypothetical protein